MHQDMYVLARTSAVSSALDVVTVLCPHPENAIKACAEETPALLVSSLMFKEGRHPCSSESFLSHIEKNFPNIPIIICSWGDPVPLSLAVEGALRTKFPHIVDFARSQEEYLAVIEKLLPRVTAEV